MVIRSRRTKWSTLSTYFKYPENVRKAIYTTNAVEAINRQFRKFTKTKGGFPNEKSLFKLLYAGILKASDRSTHPVQNWNLMLSQFGMHFEGRLGDHIALWSLGDMEFGTPSEAKMDIGHYLMDYYNKRCPRSYNNCLSSAAAENKLSLLSGNTWPLQLDT